MPRADSKAVINEGQTSGRRMATIVQWHNRRPNLSRWESYSRSEITSKRTRTITGSFHMIRWHFEPPDQFPAPFSVIQTAQFCALAYNRESTEIVAKILNFSGVESKVLSLGQITSHSVRAAPECHEVAEAEIWLDSSESISEPTRFHTVGSFSISW